LVDVAVAAVAARKQLRSHCVAHQNRTTRRLLLDLDSEIHLLPTRRVVATRLRLQLRRFCNLRAQIVFAVLVVVVDVVLVDVVVVLLMLLLLLLPAVALGCFVVVAVVLLLLLLLLQRISGNGRLWWQVSVVPTHPFTFTHDQCEDIGSVS